MAEDEKADIFVHPDFLNRVRNKEIDENTNPFYLAYLKSIKEKMKAAQFGVLAYNPYMGDPKHPDTDKEYTDLFSTPERLCIPTKKGSGEPYDHSSHESLSEHIETLCPKLIVVHGSYANACVKEMVSSVRSITDQRVVLGIVLSRYFGDGYPVPHESFSEMHPDMADTLDYKETNIHGIRYL